MDINIVTIRLVPEKKGLILKHSEYEITSRKHKVTVVRRYNDFVTLYNLLVTRFPYRMLPRLPPKQIMLDSLLEERRRGLQRWLQIVCQHPIVGIGPMLECFLTDTTSDHQDHLRTVYAKELDEFLKLADNAFLFIGKQIGAAMAITGWMDRCPKALNMQKNAHYSEQVGKPEAGRFRHERNVELSQLYVARNVYAFSMPDLVLRVVDLHGKDNFEELPLEDQGRLAASREMMRIMLNCIIRIKRLAEQQMARIHNQGLDMREMSTVLTNIDTSSGCFEPDIFGSMTTGLQKIADINAKSAGIQISSIVEKINLLLDVLTGHSDLCDRVEKGIVSEHQRAIAKMLNINKQKIKGVIRGSAAESVAALHEKEVAQTGVVGSLGRRSAFSLQCVLQETALARKYLQVLPSILLSFCYEQQQNNIETAKVWENIVASEANQLNQ